jgi:hypothetical protein
MKDTYRGSMARESHKCQLAGLCCFELSHASLLRCITTGMWDPASLRPYCA